MKSWTLNLKRLSLFLLKGSHLLLYFHRVGAEQEDFYPDGLSSHDLLQIISSFQNLGFRFCSLSEAYAQAGSSRELTVSLTSDDGFACNYCEVLPMLQAHNIPLTLFMIGKCLDNLALAWNHKLIQIRQHSSAAQLQEAVKKLQTKYALAEDTELMRQIFSVPDQEKDALCDELWDRFCPESQAAFLRRTQPFLSAKQMQELENSGAEFALHSQSHADFSRLSFPAMVYEIQQNKSALAQYSNRIAPFFGFPYGKACHSELIPQLCRESEISACLGFRYRSIDNRHQDHLWQRISLEHAAADSFEQLILRPLLRCFKHRNS